MNNPRRCFFQLSCLALMMCFTTFVSMMPAADGGGKIVAGSKLESLTAGKATYQNVLVRSVSARSAMITHSAGMASVLLRDLPPELQQRFGYNAEADRAQNAVAKAGQAALEQQQQARLEAVRKNRAASRGVLQPLGKIDQLLRSFGQPPEIAEEVDLRPRFSELGLWVKDQGHRPSCAVFAMVSALEFQSAEMNNNAQRFSEEYLFWATSKSLRRSAAPGSSMAASDGSEDQSDSGFTLDEVATALRTYGIPLRDKVPNRFSGKAMENPSDEIIEDARRGNHTSVHTIPGHDGAALATNLIHALNLGIPVPVGLRWPDTRVWRVQFLDGQMTNMNYGHAVTVVGYRCKTGRIEDAVFVFKNSWGPRWGQAGYGTASYAYLSKNLGAAVVLEVTPENK